MGLRSLAETRWWASPSPGGRATSKARRWLSYWPLCALGRKTAFALLRMLLWAVPWRVVHPPHPNPAQAL